MTRLSDTQLVILSAAAQRDDLSVLPLPETLDFKGGALNKVMDSLRKQGLIRVLGGDGGPERVIITSEGMAAIGIETADDTPEGARPADAGATAAEAEAQGMDALAPVTGADGSAVPAKTGKAAKGKARVTAAASADRPAPRAGTKQAQMIEMLKRPEGATVEQIAAVTGWQHHTVRGAISGALKKKLGLTVEARRSAPTSVVGGGSQARRTREVGRNKTGAKGSATVYRITGSPPVAG